MSDNGREVVTVRDRRADAGRRDRARLIAKTVKYLPDQVAAVEQIAKNQGLVSFSAGARWILDEYLRQKAAEAGIVFRRSN